MELILSIIKSTYSRNIANNYYCGNLVARLHLPINICKHDLTSKVNITFNIEEIKADLTTKLVSHMMSSINVPRKLEKHSLKGYGGYRHT